MAGGKDQEEDQVFLRSSTPTSYGEMSAATDSDFGFAEGTAPRLTEEEEFVVVDLTACRLVDFEHGLPCWWASNLQQYRGRCVIQIKVQAGAEQMVQKTLEMMMSKPTVGTTRVSSSSSCRLLQVRGLQWRRKPIQGVGWRWEHEWDRGGSAVWSKFASEARHHSLRSKAGGIRDS